MFPKHGDDDTGEPMIDSSHLLTVRLLCQREILDWELAKCLHGVSLPTEIDAHVIAICARLHRHGSSILSWVGNDVYKLALARVIGCSHAITDVSLPLGSQSIGRGLFPEHSFYNHSCIPNAFLSCDLMTERNSNDHKMNVSARLHLLSDIKAGDQISISYVPTSGLGFQERQHRLGQGYDFVCECDACKNQEILLLPNTDVDSIREIQFSCNERMFNMPGSEIDVEEIGQIISLVEMTKRGIQNQAIPQSHEVSIESDRLLAMAYSLSGQNQEAAVHHQSFFSKVKHIGHLFDPVALATQNLEFANVADGDLKTELQEKGIYALTLALGEDHPWVRVLSPTLQSSVSQPRNNKKRNASS